MTDWKALCRELVTAVESNCKEHIISHDLNCAYMKADAALAQPEPEAPTDEELLFAFYEASLAEGGDTDEVTLRDLRAVLARWGK
jgi:hypothetical protein